MKHRRTMAAFIGLFAAILILLAANICIGSVQIPLSELPGILSGSDAGSVNAQIVMQIRFPRALGAAILGGALALAGYLLQTFFHNPVAGPYILGISSGAKLVVALAMVFFLQQAIEFGSLVLILAAFIGALLSMCFVLLLSRVLDSMPMLIVGGVMIGYICSAITDFVVNFADDSDIVNLHNWSQGSFSGISWNHVAVISVVIAAAFLCAFLLSKPISAYQMGEAYARSVGLNIRLFRVLLILLASVLAAAVTAFAGPVSFVGMAVPQLMKNLLRSAKPIILIPACFLGGAAFCLLCDLLARTLFSPTELSISTMTAVFGAPIVIWVLIKSRRESGV